MGYIPSMGILCIRVSPNHDSASERLHALTKNAQDQGQVLRNT